MIRELDDLSDVRFKIIKSMFAEFPELKIQITKEIFIEGLDPKERQGRSLLGNHLATIATNSRLQREQSFSEKNLKKDDRNSPGESVPLWAKFAMASSKKGSDGKYYVFK